MPILEDAVTEHCDAAALEGRRVPKVLFLIDTLLGVGGAEDALRKIVTHLPRHGYACSIATFRLMHDEAYLKTYPCPIYEFPVRRTYGWSGVRGGIALAKLAIRERFDIVHSFFPTSDLWGAPIIRMVSRPLFVSSRRDMGILRRPMHKVVYRWMGALYDQVQTVSEQVRQISIEEDGLRPERVATVYNGVEFESIAATAPWRDLAQSFDLDPEGHNIITSMGRVWPVKGIDILIRAAAKVCREFPHTNFIVAGWSGGDYTAELVELANSLGVGKNVKFIGRSKQIISILKASDVFCLLSRSEGTSNALLEAMACGLPAVASRVGGNPEVVADGESGFVVPSEDADAAAERLLQLLRSAALRQQMGRTGYNIVQSRFTVDAMTGRMADLYDDLLAERRV